MNRARATDRTAAKQTTTGFQQRLTADASDNVVDLTRVKLTRYVSTLRDPVARRAAAALVSRYDSGTIVVAWRAGRPVYRDE